jgi:hypothetical protein
MISRFATAPSFYVSGCSKSAESITALQQLGATT